MRRMFTFCTISLIASNLAAQVQPAEYAARRDSLAARLDSGVVVVFGGRTPVTDFGPFWQLPNFRYLTGYLYADATLVMTLAGGQVRSATLFANRSTPRRSLYYGPEPDSADIARLSGGLASRDAGQLAPVLDSLAGAGASFWAARDFEDADFQLADSLTRGGRTMDALASRHPGLRVRDAQAAIAELRARKSAAELDLIRRAAAISASGHRAVLRAARPGMYEYQLAATLEYGFKNGGGERPAYGSIVGSGPNALQLHYMRDERRTVAGDVVVMDAAAEYDGYAADITRTIPISGRFTPDQRAIYQLVRDAQAAAERNSKAGLSAQAAQDSSLDVRSRGLAALGLIEAPDAQLDLPWPANCAANPRNCQQVQLWAIHGISHGLGLAVHDPAQYYGGDHTFKVGDAFTIEPGLYVNPKVLDLLPNTPRNQAFIQHVRAAVQRYQNIGVRIEDDYVITPQGTERITPAPREIAEIEAAMRQADGGGGASRRR